MMQQFAMMTTTQPAVQQSARNFMSQTAAQPPATPHTFAPHTIPILAPTQQWGLPNCSNTCFCNSGRGHCNPCSAAPPGIPVPFSGRNQMIPYIPAGIQPPTQPQNPCYSNVVKNWSNQNVCFSCRFDVEDWHTSATCPCKKMGHQDAFTCSNYIDYERANHQFCKKVMHKTMYLQM